MWKSNFCGIAYHLMMVDGEMNEHTALGGFHPHHLYICRPIGLGLTLSFLI